MRSLLLWTCWLSGQLRSLRAQQVLAEFVMLNYTWDDSHQYQDYIESGKFVPENNLLAGIKLDNMGNIFLTVPRWKSGVPATLNRFATSASGEYELAPYPSWDMQREGVEGDLQNCQSMYIDSTSSRMWIIEVGLRNFFMGPGGTVPGRPGVWLLDMHSLEVLSKYYFPSDVISSEDSFLDDIVVDESNNIAYLTDASGDGALLVYDFNAQRSRRYSGASTKNEPDYMMVIDGVNYGKRIFTTPVDGIAISADRAFIYYCAVQGTRLYRVPTSVLGDLEASQTEIDRAVSFMGSKPPSDGIIFWGNDLYYGSLPESTIYMATIIGESAGNATTGAIPLPPDVTKMHWVDTLSLDPFRSDRVWFVSNELDKFIVGTMDFSGHSGANMRIVWTNRIVQ